MTLHDCLTNIYLSSEFSLPNSSLLSISGHFKRFRPTFFNKLPDHHRFFSFLRAWLPFSLIAQRLHWKSNNKEKISNMTSDLLAFISSIHYHIDYVIRLIIIIWISINDYKRTYWLCLPLTEETVNSN